MLPSPLHPECQIDSCWQAHKKYQWVYFEHEYQENTLKGNVYHISNILL